MNKSKYKIFYSELLEKENKEENKDLANKLTKHPVLLYGYRFLGKNAQEGLKSIGQNVVGVIDDDK